MSKALTVDITCGDTKEGFRCTHLQYHKGDHAEIRWSGNIPRTAAFWNADHLTVVNP